ncbi:glycoside hydrolase family 32 protein [Echinicola marina]|uniref:glycoside hydrolase family 32 protein n=1 Tax=Echinicola marina TaxID=2859768 RepID=UPI001CF63657|nr:glycoside hydrolase family 32 protein [Echinicola marina]UCS93106.1 glycoside hydrolase family 32 protein [Echinicola marina]
MKTSFNPLIYLLILGMFAACTESKKEKQAELEIPNSEPAFDETYRPQYHFTPPKSWMNDPNGMVYLDGEYHLFYQHNPDSNVWGPMHWGHAVSTDMLHWEHLPIALYPDSLGTIFSGSAVIDKGNTSGLGEDGKNPMIAIFTYHHPEKGQTQGIAFSNDKGRTWTKYKNNPVLNNPGIPDFRDPKVSWYDQGNGTGKWIMTLAVKDKISFYSSPNLIDWEHESDFSPSWASYGGVWECPDLFPLTDQEGHEKWVLLVSINPGGPNGGSATQYFTGNFDGGNFTADGKDVKWIDYGADNYAGVTWSDIPKTDGRRLFLGWMSNWLYANIVPTTIWRSAMTLPRKLELYHFEGKDLLASRPVMEVKTLYGNSEKIEAKSHLLRDELFHLDLKTANGNRASIKFSNDLGEEVLLHIEQNKVIFDRSKSGQVKFNEAFQAIHEAPLNGLEINDIDIYSDKSSLEFFFNDGELVLTEILFPNSPLLKLDLEGIENNGEVHYLNSTW